MFVFLQEDNGHPALESDQMKLYSITCELFHWQSSTRFLGLVSTDCFCKKNPLAVKEIESFVTYVKMIKIEKMAGKNGLEIFIVKVFTKF